MIQVHSNYPYIDILIALHSSNWHHLVSYMFIYFLTCGGCTDASYWFSIVFHLFLVRFTRIILFFYQWNTSLYISPTFYCFRELLYIFCSPFSILEYLPQFQLIMNSRVNWRRSTCELSQMWSALTYNIKCLAHSCDFAKTLFLALIYNSKIAHSSLPQTDF